MKNEKGVALPAVLMVMLIIMALSVGVVSLVRAQTKEQIYYESNTSALHAAEAGLNQYLWNLNKEGSTPLDMGTVFYYPESNPVAAYILTDVTDGGSFKVIKSTGWRLSDPDVKRTVTSTFNKRSFTQYVYFSDNDPANIWWTSSDNCYGPYHTNTNLSVDGTPNFWKIASYSGELVRGSGANPTFHEGHKKLDYTIDMPENNSELMYYALQPDGYYFEGRTSILLKGDGTMKIWNPNYSPATWTLPLPENGVIYVNEKVTHNNNNKFDPNNGNVFISGVLNGRLTVAAKNDIFITGYDPTVNTFASAAVTDGVTYKDTVITLDFVDGKPVLGDNEATLPEGAGDMLGLIADRNVAILTYGWFDNGSVNSSRQKFKVYAALMALEGSFINSVHFDNRNNPSFNSSYPTSNGVLTVRGSIIQNTRGAVGFTSGTGYKKDYAHDPRMNYDQPPHFLDPEGSGWEITEWNEER